MSCYIVRRFINGNLPEALRRMPAQLDDDHGISLRGSLGTFVLRLASCLKQRSGDMVSSETGKDLGRAV
jgi:hypothetical protein